MQVQVWNSTTGHLIAEFGVPPTQGAKITWKQSVFYGHPGKSPVFDGWGIWRDLPIRAPRENQLEIRINAQAASMVNVYTVSLTPYSP